MTPRDFQTEDISIWLYANATPSPLGADALRGGTEKVISLYPDIPGAGSPFGTGKETFGTGPGYKRQAAIYTLFNILFTRVIFSVLTSYCCSDGDVQFKATRRFWSRTTLAPNYVYLFTGTQPSADPALGVFHCRATLSLWEHKHDWDTRSCKSESQNAGLLDLICSLPDSERRQGNE